MSVRQREHIILSTSKNHAVSANGLVRTTGNRPLVFLDAVE